MAALLPFPTTQLAPLAPLAPLTSHSQLDALAPLPASFSSSDFSSSSASSTSSAPSSAPASPSVETIDARDIHVVENWSEKNALVYGQGTKLFSKSLKSLNGRKNASAKLDKKSDTKVYGYTVPVGKLAELRAMVAKMLSGELPQEKSEEPKAKKSPEAEEKDSKIQHVAWKVPRPVLGQEVSITKDTGIPSSYKVFNIPQKVTKNKTQAKMIDTIFVKAVASDDTLKLVVLNGDWKVWNNNSFEVSFM